MRDTDELLPSPTSEETVFKLVVKQHPQSHIKLSFATYGEMQCEYAEGHTTYPIAGTDGLFAFRTLEQAMALYRAIKDPQGVEVWQAHATGIRAMPVNYVPHLCGASIIALEFWSDPQHWQGEKREFAEGTCLCDTITLKKRIH